MDESPLPARPSLIKQWGLAILAILASLLVLTVLSSLGAIDRRGPGCFSELSDHDSAKGEWAFNKTSYGWPIAYLSIQRERPGCIEPP
ncbi:MAG: hypothetical protein H0T53_06850, partial [Herpetosiphonaceae bacterium]|nr:hypothetical protein [Herpetosiphonaceae bacterium]